MSAKHLDHVSLGRGNPAVLFRVTANGHGRVTEPKGDHLSDRILDMIPKQSLESVVRIVVRQVINTIREISYKLFPTINKGSCPKYDY